MPTSPVCEGCPQRCQGQRLIETDGTGINGILMVGESGWVDEAKVGKPFVGAAGNFLNRLLRRIGLDRQSFIIANSMWCIPPRLGWFQSREAAEALNHCRPHLDGVIERFKPKVIVTLGDTALRRVCGVTGLATRHSYVHDSPYGIPVVPTFHPSFVMQGQQKYSGAVLFALKRAVAIAQAGGRFERTPTDYYLDSPLDVLESYMADWKGEPLAFDIETPRSAKLDEDDTEQDDSYTIIRASMSYKAGTSASFPWTEPYIGLVKRVLAAAPLAVFWNGGFDIPRLEAAGVRIGETLDAMWAFHFLQSDMPKGLGFVAPFYTDLPPFKHLSDAMPEFYSACDADATIRCFDGIKRDLEKQGRWEAFLRHCVKVSPLLNRMGGKGLLVDKAEQTAFKERLERELEEAKATLQTKVPEAICPRKTYKKPPPELAALPPTRYEACPCAMEDQDLALDGERPKCRKCKGEGKFPVWDKVLPFNPDSPPQVMALIKHYGLQPPKNRKTGGESTGAKYLERFAKKHEVFRWVLESRKRADMLGTFIWPTNAEGRVTTQYGFHPSTWRKCVAKGTRISTPAGEIPVERLKVGQLVYTYDDQCRLTLRPVLWAGKTGRKRVIRLHWKAMGCHGIKGYLDVTPDHLVRLLDGSYKEAAKLDVTWGRRKRTKPGDRILALHRGDFEGGYIRLSGTGFPNGKSWILEHRFVYWFFTGEWPQHVHHKNDVKDDNRLSNLEGMTISEHITLTGLRKGRRNRGRIAWEKYQLRKHLEVTQYPYDVPLCNYQAANHRITAIEELPTEVDVYDVEVEETHNFIANELCVHNSSRNVNLQNIPRRSDLAQEFRKMLVAASGHVLIEADSAAIEAVLVGYCAGDEDYIRAAKLGIHGFTTSHWINDPVDLQGPDEEVKRKLKAVKRGYPEQYEAAKRGGHATNYLLSAFGLQDEYPDFFPSKRKAEEFQQFYFSLFPKVKQWQNSTLERAHKETFLDNHFQYRHYFYDVFGWNAKTQGWTLGNDAKRCVAFVPQSDASAIQTEYLLRLAEDEQMVEWLRLIIHDSIVAEVPVEAADYACQRLYKVMTMPLPQLGGLSIGAEIKVGENLKDVSIWEPKVEAAEVCA
jgi:uracil-DNA glycosylase family 4